MTRIVASAHGRGGRIATDFAQHYDVLPKRQDKNDREKRCPEHIPLLQRDSKSRATDNRIRNCLAITSFRYDAQPDVTVLTEFRQPVAKNSAATPPV